MTHQSRKEQSMSLLLEKLGDYVKEHDPATDPRYATVAGLLAEAATEAQRHGQALAQLSERTDQILRSGPTQVVHRHFHRQSDWCADILARSPGPRRYGDIAKQMYAEGYRHAVTVKNPDRQLSDSIWVAMNEDDRFVKVGRGIFDLAARLPSS
jgi:hypothetical protein